VLTADPADDPPGSRRDWISCRLGETAWRLVEDAVGKSLW